jgi:hypothetical protein
MYKLPRNARITPGRTGMPSRRSRITGVGGVSRPRVYAMNSKGPVRRPMTPVKRPMAQAASPRMSYGPRPVRSRMGPRRRFR